MPSTDPRPGLFRRTLRHWKGLLALWLVGTLALGALAYFRVKPLFRAISLIRVDPQVTDLYGVRGGGESMDAFLETEVQLITSPNVLTSAGANPKVSVLEGIREAGDVVQELRKVLSVSVIPKTYLIEVASTSTSSFEAATVVNAVVDAFMEANSEWSDGMNRAQIKSLEGYSLDLKNQTDELERRWKDLAAKSDVDVLNFNRKKEGAAKPEPGSDRAGITIEEYRLAYRDLKAVQLELAEAQAWLATARKSFEKSVKVEEAVFDQDVLQRQDRQVERMFKMDLEVVPLMTEMRKAQVKVQEAMRVSDKAGDPALVKANRNLESLKRQYNQLWEEKQLALREQIGIAAGGEKGLSPDQEVKEAAKVVEKLENKKKVLEEHFKNLNVKNANQASDAVDIALIQDERATLKEMQDAVTRRLEQLRFEAKGEARVRPVNAAIPPARPYLDRRPKLVLGIIPLAMLLAVFGLFASVEAFSGAAPKVEGPAKVEPPKEV